MAHFVYILHSTSRNRFYIGASSQPEERLKKHNHHHKGFTGGTNDWSIVYLQEFQNKADALAREKEIKSWKSAQRIRQLTGLEHPGL